MRDIWVDVRVVSAPPDAMASQTVRQAEQEKRRVYVAHHLNTTQNVFDGLRPFVIEHYGRLGEAACSLLMQFVANKARWTKPTANVINRHKRS